MPTLFAPGLRVRIKFRAVEVVRVLKVPGNKGQASLPQPLC